jgi:hypothetical protein
MSERLRLDCRFLEAEFRRRVERKYSARVETMWNVVLGAFKPKKELTYLPTIFVIPFYPFVQQVILHDPQKGDLIDRRSMDALTATDADDPDNWAIYLVYGLVKKAYDRLFMAILAEELAHFYMRLKGISKAGEIIQMYLEGKGQAETYDKKEEELKDFHLLFEEPVCSYIQEAKQKGQPTVQQGREFCEGSKPIPQDNFLEAILGSDRAKRHLEKQVEKLKQLRQPPQL